MNTDKPWNDVADQLRPARQDADAEEQPPRDAPVEADPADVADQHRVVPLPDDEPWP